jgi:hypothetical protein
MRRWCLILCAVWVGCGGSGFETTEPDASAGTGGTAGTGGASAAAGSSGTAGEAGTANPCPGACAPSVSGWEGPLVVREGSGLPPLACATPYSFRGELESPSDCPCACQEDPDTGGRQAVVRWYTTSDCSGAPCRELSLQANQCEPIPNAPCPPLPGVDVATVAFCKVSGSTEPAEPTWGIEGQACPAVSAPGTCGGADTCYALATSDRLCILQSGEADCPGPYTEQRFRFQGVDDDRKCSPCVCEPTSKVGNIMGSDTATCGGPTQFSEVPGLCFTMPGSTYLKYANITGAKFQCAPAEMPTMSGSAKPTGEVTFCCLP